MNIKKSHFWYNSRQRNGILFLAILIIAFQLIYFLVDFNSKETIDLNTPEIIQFQKELDSLKQLELKKRKSKIFPFNPSFLSDFKGYQLGMSTEEIDRLLEHRSKGKYINSKKEFQQVTGVSDSLLNTISPYFKFPDWVIKKQQTKKTPVILSTSEESQNLPVKDINTVTEEELKIINGVGDRLAQRIINYRNKLEGFLINEQLYEVYYLDKEVADRVLKRFQVLQKPIINKINVNEAAFKEVLSIVYIDYELTKKIFNYRDEVAELQSLEELKQIEGFPLEKFDRIALYLEAK